MALVRLETFNANGTIVFTEDIKLIIDSANNNIIIICIDYAQTPAGNFQNQFVMEANNSTQIPIVDLEGLPVWENPQAPENERVQSTIGEWDMLKLLTDNKIITLPQALAGAILRKKG